LGQSRQDCGENEALVSADVIKLEQVRDKVSWLASLKGKGMIARITEAALRGVLVSLVVATPALTLPSVSIDSSQATVFISLIAAVMVFLEYYSDSPSIVEFRDAAPVNRLRFFALFATVLILSLIGKGMAEPTDFTEALTSIGTIVGSGFDFAFSPVRLVVLMLPAGTDVELTQTVRAAAGISCLISVLAVSAFVFVVRVRGWPTPGSCFNLWVNLPLFNPTAGPEMLHRLRRDAWLNIAFGFLLPFVIPAVVKAVADLIDPFMLQNPQTLIWTLTAWAFFPANMIMRGIAMQRIAEIARDQRKRAFTTSEGELRVI
jgi:hypothetical protein